MSDNSNQNVDNWVQQLTDQDMPIFAGTVSDVTHAVNNDDTSATDVASTILKDASLTGRLLKMANSFYYNPAGHQINTVTRAVMILGFDQVRALALSLILIDSLSSTENREKIIEEMAQSFHAAVQAQELAKLVDNQEPENIFVATLLSRLGNMAFWAFSGEKGVALQELIDSGEMSEQEAEHKVLGFHLHSLTKDLSKSWSLGELLDKSLNDTYKSDPLVELIHMGQSLAQEAKNGWEEDSAQEALKAVSKKLKLPVKKVEELAYRNAKKAKEITKNYGITSASRRIPVENVPLVEVEVENETLVDEDTTTNEQTRANNETALGETVNGNGDRKVTDEGSAENESVSEERLTDTTRKNKNEPRVSVHQPNAEIQLSVLQEITEAIEDKPSINAIIEMVLEGVYRGVGMDRAIFAIISQDRKKLICKYALGDRGEYLTQNFRIDISHASNIFNQVISSKKGMHIPSNPKQIRGTVCKATFDLLGYPPYIIMPTIIKNKVVGIFMADRNASKRGIEQKDFLSFQQFCQQANMGLTFLTMQD